MSYSYEILEHKKDHHKYIEIKGCDGKAENLIIPEKIDGVTVEAIGNHSFSGRDDIVTVSLPNTITTLGGFAFHNCRNLRRISLYDSVDDYYDGVCRQCDRLTDIDITIRRGWYEVIRNFLADNDKTLRFMIHRDNFRSLLTFPEYVYDFADNTMARTIQFSISGSGYAYRECVDRRSISYREYDKLFEKAVIDGNVISEDIALGRLLYPYELDDPFMTRYEDFVRKNMDSIMKRLIGNIEESDKGHFFDSEIEGIEAVRKILEYKRADIEPLCSEKNLDMAVQLAADKKLIVLSAVLMECGSKSSSISEFSF